MADWTLILTTVGASGISGTLGFGVAWLGARTARAQIAAENERLREQHEEDHLRNRQGTYHDFLTVDSQMARTLGQEFANADVETVQVLYDRWTHLANGVLLFGTIQVGNELSELQRAYKSIDNAVERGDVGAAASAWKEAAPDIRKARRTLIGAMRRDVSPDSAILTGGRVR